jgi:hypothetical protein
VRPLRESPESLNHGEQLLAALFESVPKNESDPFAKRRIRAKIVQRAQSRRGGLTVAVVLGTLGLATAAAAMVGTGPWSSRWSSALSPTIPVAAKEAVPMAAPITVPTAAPAAAPSVALAVSVPSEPVAPASSPLPRAVPAAGEDPTLVASAIQALRSEHDPARARQLLSRYLKTNPRGALAEEALALSIEAAATMQDRQASSLARTYLSVYPNGRHRKLAQRVLDKSAEP